LWRERGATAKIIDLGLAKALGAMLSHEERKSNVLKHINHWEALASTTAHAGRKITTDAVLTRHPEREFPGKPGLRF
jgi:hypothetical protein